MKEVSLNMAHDQRDSLHTKEADRSILHHLFLPCHLPHSDQDDFLTKDDHINEYELLECMRDFFCTQDGVTHSLPIYSVMKKCVTNWSNLQNFGNLNLFNLQTTIEQLQSGEFFSLYFHKQNAAILIEIDEGSRHEPLISSWQVLLPTNEITSSLKPHLASFPMPTYRLNHRSQLTSRAQCELLTEFMKSNIEYSKSWKASHQFNETRDVPESHYVCQWWIMQFEGVTVMNDVNTSNQFNKKHRDQIRWNDGRLRPFRRSGLWIAMKVVLQTMLTKRLKDYGTLIYKLLITHFLIYVIHVRKVNASMEILVHCLRKIARRLNKIDVLLGSRRIDSDDMNRWIQQTREDIQGKMTEILPRSDWQQAIRLQESQFQKLSVNNLNLNDVNIYRHRCEELDKFLNMTVSNTSQLISLGVNNHSYSTMTVNNPMDDIPSIELLTNQLKYDVGRALTRVEISVELNLEKWIDRPTSSLEDNDEKRFKTLLDFYQNYKTNALNHYCPSEKPLDSIGYSRFILTSLTILYCIHEKLCRNTRFERLKEHSIVIPNLIELFEYLVLPTRDDMIRAYQLYNYFSRFKSKTYPDLLSPINSSNAFGVHFASQSETMNASLQEIQVQSELDKKAKIQEVKDAKERYQSLITRANSLTCECEDIWTGYRMRKIWCKKCNIERDAGNIKVSIYECPIPSEHVGAMAVMFELQMPLEIRYFREILWLFINRPRPESSCGMYGWLDTRPHKDKLSCYFIGPSDIHVKLVSSCKSVTQSHYSQGISNFSSPEAFLFENSLKVQITPSNTISLPAECDMLTPQLINSSYKSLQFSIKNTQFAQNQVIAMLSDCPMHMKTTQFIEFGSFRSGHCLQWWNLLSILELESLPIEDESVVILITHSLLQYGPVKDQNTLDNFWCSEAHRSILDDRFVDELIRKLNRRLDDYEFNWQNELVLIIITMIAMRIFTLCNSTREKEAADLVLKCRQVGEKWIDLILSSIQIISSNVDETAKLRNKLVIVGIACQLTYSVHPTRLRWVLATNKHIISLLKAITTVHDNTILNKDQLATNIFINQIMRFSRRVVESIQSLLAKLLSKMSYQSLNDFSMIYWAVLRSKGTINANWRKRTSDVYDSWYDGQYQSVRISIDCSRGIFLINGMTVGFLPEKITSSKLFLRVFENHIFEVQADQTPNIYITKNSYHGESKVRYTFYVDNKTDHVIICEQYDDRYERFQLVSHECFAKELPEIFVSNYSHWRNMNNQQIEFRPVHFQNPNFLKDKAYVFAMDTGYLTTSNKKQILVNQSSLFFHNLYKRYFHRLDDQPYVYMMNDNASHIIDNTLSSNDAIIHIYLARLGIAFKYHTDDHTIKSREYSEMYIAEDQWLGTLTGLQSGLLLSPIAGNETDGEYYQCRKLIVPFGEVRIAQKTNNKHQIVTIERKSYLHQYFTYNLNDQLRIIQSTDSPTGWLYLALLHAVTSHPLPDQYTGMTGMERSFQLLKSAGCWTDQPYDEISQNILCQVAAISPKVEYYPPHLTVMVKIKWKSDILPYSLQHFGYYLMTKNLMDVSEKLNFMYSSSKPTTQTKLTSNNERLLGKLYWDYRDFYNSEARLTKELEKVIFYTCSTSPYHSTLPDCSFSTCDQRIDLTDDMYRNGSVDLKDESQLDLFPLVKWLGGDYQLKTVWVGLLKKASCATTRNYKDEMEKFEILLDFLHYISVRTYIRPFYLQMLRTVLKTPAIIVQSHLFPIFGQYNSIEEISVQKGRIPIPYNCPKDEEEKILRKITMCFQNNSNFSHSETKEFTVDSETINKLLTSWRRNKELRSFLELVQSRICSVAILSLNERVAITSQKFLLESIESHHRIQFRTMDKPSNSQLILNARRKFSNRSSENLIRLERPIKLSHAVTKFPDQIFPSLDEQQNSLSDIASHFHTQLLNSWKQLFSVKQYEKEYPSTKQIEQLLHSSRQESKQCWNELLALIKSPNQFLIETGVVSRIIPTTLISLLLKIWLKEKQQQDFHPAELDINLTADQCTLLGGTLVNWVYEQQMERALYFARNKRMEEFEREITNRPHTNWSPSDHLPWLIMELEMNITIRETQVQVAYHMMQSNATTPASIVMQMNMGEGKTSVIIPMLALSLCSASSSLVRIIVLKSLFIINYQSLRYKLGGLLNRRIFSFACRRRMNFSQNQLHQIFERFKDALSHCDIILTAPEYILSFDLLTVDKCRRDEFTEGRLMMNMQKWLKMYTRDVLDESDEILHVKYQLIYTVGSQEAMDGGTERWKIIQKVLQLVKNHAPGIANDFNEEVVYQPCERQSAFPQIRLLSNRPFVALCKKIAKDWLREKTFRATDQQIESFILESDSSIRQLEKQSSDETIKLLLILRGLLSSEVLFVALQKRYRVNYGVNRDRAFNRLMAVPFRAKDVAAENTEFGHPDVAIVLTQLSYYYNGLDHSQLKQCFQRLQLEELNPALIYNEWISYDNLNVIHSSIQEWKGVNLNDYQQRVQYLFPVLQHNVKIIDYFLDHFVFPREAKQFPAKLIASPWDLSSPARSKIITGFSGTNDTQLLLPIHIRQCDLPQLQHTDALVVRNLLRDENEHYRDLPNDVTSEQILKRIVNCRLSIQVILDVGALFIDGTNRQIAVQWLELSDRNTIEYAVYFESDSIMVCDRQFRHHPFLTSPASERLDRCVIYLDEIHTRGCDFKFPTRFRAALTLGHGLTKDRLVQAAMRMRKLGSGHSLIFWSSFEVDRLIRTLKTDIQPGNPITLLDILRWVYENTQQATWDGLHHWSAQSLTYQQKTIAMQDISWDNMEQSLPDAMITEVATNCLEPEVLKLEKMYGTSKYLQNAYDIYLARFKRSKISISTGIHDDVSKQLKKYGGTRKRLAQLLDEEQERELEQELEEEREIERPSPVRPCTPILHDPIKKLPDKHGPELNLAELTRVFSPLLYAFKDTTFFNKCQTGSWNQSLWISTEFQRVVETSDEALDPFLRPPRWIVVYRGKHIIFVNALEANWLMNHLNPVYHTTSSNDQPTTTLRLLLPRLKRSQEILVNVPILTIPSTIAFHNYRSISLECLVELFVFNGTLYFQNSQEENAFCKYLGICPNPRTLSEKEAFDKGWISPDGFVSQPTHRHELNIGHVCRFHTSPLPLVKQIIEIRNNSYPTMASDVGSIVFNQLKLHTSSR